MYPFKKKIYPFILSAKFFSLLVILLKETDLFPHLLYQEKKLKETGTHLHTSGHLTASLDKNRTVEIQKNDKG